MGLNTCRSRGLNLANDGLSGSTTTLEAILHREFRNRVTDFGLAPDGTPVKRVEIANGGSTAFVMTWGASLQDFRIDGIEYPLVLGSPTLPPYWDPMRYFGAIVGRVANRIAAGRATLDGENLTLECNESGRNMLHGGDQGSWAVPWSLVGYDAHSCQMRVVLPDGQGGFPGAIDLLVTYALDGNGALSIDLAATSNAPTFCALAHHSYWNLDGRSDVSQHHLKVSADRYLPVDAYGVPTGRPQHVYGTVFDYHTARPIGAELDHNFCLNAEQVMQQACTLEAGGLRLDVETTEPGLQVYSGKHINTGRALGLCGAPYGAGAGVALEPQHWPDAPNQPDYPSIVLRPGQVYRQRSVFRVQRRAG